MPILLPNTRSDCDTEQVVRTKWKDDLNTGRLPELCFIRIKLYFMH